MHVPFSRANTETDGDKQQPRTRPGLPGTLSGQRPTTHWVHQTCSKKGDVMGGFSHRLELTIPTARTAAARRC